MSSKGFLMLSQNSETDYVMQACLCAMSIHASNKEASVSLVTNNEVPEKYKLLFDNIIPIPWTEEQQSENSLASANRWKLYHATPYEETIVLDTDMLVLQDLSSWWAFLNNYEMYFVSNVQTYRGKQVVDHYYRKAFKANQLPNLYVGFHYFKKCDFAHEFYKWMELVVNNWELFYGKYVSEHYPKSCTMDVTAALVAKILNCEDKITNSLVKYPTFTHMKPYIQGWNYPSASWQSRVGTYLTQDLKLTIGNHLQQGIFHYTENDFVNEDIISRYENYLGVLDGN